MKTKHFLFSLLCGMLYCFSFTACEPQNGPSENESPSDGLVEDVTAYTPNFLVGENGLYYIPISSSSAEVTHLLPYDLRLAGYLHTTLPTYVIIPEKIRHNGKTYTVISIGTEAFAWHVEDISKIDMPSTITSIGARAFASCANLTSITIPDGVTSIEEETFSTCESLSSITIPNSIKMIKNSAFTNCKYLAEIYSYIKEPHKVNVAYKAFTRDELHDYRYHYDRAILYVPKDTKSLYESTDIWKEFEQIVEME